MLPSGYMRPMLLRISLRWTAWLISMAVVLFTLSPAEFRPVTWAPAGFERLAAGAVIGGILGLAYPRHRIGIMWMIIGGITLLELAQHAVPGRHGRFGDGIVKVSGAILGLVAVMIVDQKRPSP